MIATLRAWLEAQRDAAQEKTLRGAEPFDVELYNRARRDALNEVLAWIDGPWARATDVDHAPTVKFPPIRETVLRRPPPPTVRELKGAELLRALADEMEQDDDL